MLIEREWLGSRPKRGKGPLNWEGPQTGHSHSNHHSRQEAGRSLFGHIGSHLEGTWRCSHSAEGWDVVTCPVDRLQVESGSIP